MKAGWWEMWTNTARIDSSGIYSVVPTYSMHQYRCLIPPTWYALFLFAVMIVLIKPHFLISFKVDKLVDLLFLL